MAAATALFLPGMLDAQPAPGVAYDEVVRVFVGATPPPPGNFAAVLAAASEATPVASPAPRRRGGLLGVAEAVLGSHETPAPSAGDRILAEGAAGFATLFRMLEPGRLERHAFYNGWERIEDPVAQTATIRKCDLDQVVKLDLRRRTYRIFPAESEPSDPPLRDPGTPGSVAGTVRQTVSALGPQTLDGTEASGFEDRSTFALTQASGGCHEGSVAFTTRSYYSKAPVPRSVCPITPQRERYPEQAVNIVASGGCRPRLLAEKAGPLPPSGRLVLYRAIQFVPDASGAAGQAGFTLLTERGNLRTLTAADSNLFAIPPDFTKAP